MGGYAVKKQNGTEYYANRHSCFMLQYHLVVVTKYRKKVIKGNLKTRLLEITNDLLVNSWGCNIVAVNTDEDHIHILFECVPQVALSELVNNYKTVTARRLRKEFADALKTSLWGKQFWSDSYFICTVSDRTEAMLISYINNQGG